MPAQTKSRIARRFEALRSSGDLGLVAFVTAGDPSLEGSEQICLSLAEAGADVIELGIPFSDPLADGPTIQRSSERALRQGVNLPAVIALVKRLRQKTQVPLVLFGYFNPVLQMGLEKFAAEAAGAGADGALLTDVPQEESADYVAAMRAHQLDTIFLGAPTSSDQRLKTIAEVSSGFLYLISRTGVTGAKDSLAADLPSFLRRARKVTSLPLAVGFGISLPGHVSMLGGLADAAVVGSALVGEIERAASADDAARAVAEKVRALKQAGRKGMSIRSAETP